MKVKIIFAPVTQTERDALKLLHVREDRVDGSFESFDDADRQHRLLGALIDVLKLAIVP